MKLVTVTTRDGYTLNLCQHEGNADLPWVMLILPFGLPVQMGATFAAALESVANVAVLESRLILADEVTEVPKQAMQTERHIDDVIDACQLMPSKPAIVIGYCASAGIVMQAAVTYPEAMPKLVLVSGDYRLAKVQATQYTKDLDGIFELVEQDPSFANYFLAKLRENTQDTFAGLDAPYQLPQRLFRLAQSYRSYAKADLIHVAQQIQVPVLVLAGTQDRFINAASSVAIAAHLSNGQLVVEADADHHELFKPHSVFIQHIRQFTAGGSGELLATALRSANPSETPQRCRA